MAETEHPKPKPAGALGLASAMASPWGTPSPYKMRWRSSTAGSSSADNGMADDGQDSLIQRLNAITLQALDVLDEVHPELGQEMLTEHEKPYEEREVARRERPARPQKDIRVKRPPPQRRASRVLGKGHIIRSTKRLPVGAAADVEAAGGSSAAGSGSGVGSSSGAGSSSTDESGT